MPKVKIVNVMASYDDTIDLIRGYSNYQGYLRSYITSDDELLNQIIATDEVSYSAESNYIVIFSHYNIGIESEPMYDYDDNMSDFWHDSTYDTICIPIIFHPKTGQKIEIEYKEIDLTSEINNLIMDYNKNVKHKKQPGVDELSEKLNNDVINLIKSVSNVVL